jgi:hypothetical protein
MIPPPEKFPRFTPAAVVIPASPRAPRLKVPVCTSRRITPVRIEAAVLLGRVPMSIEVTE